MMGNDFNHVSEESEETPAANNAVPITPPPIQNEVGDGNSGKKPRLSKGKIALIVVAGLLVLGIIGSLIPCDHDWSDATCTEPKTCSKCGETDGDALGHDWQEATCTTAATCSRCGETKGEPLGHDIAGWVTDTPATCSAEGSQHGICSRCGETQTASIPTIAHTEGEWVTTQAPTVSSTGIVTPGTQALLCSVCGATIRTEQINLDVTVSQKNALRSAQSYLSFSAFSYSGLIDQLEFEGYSTEDATFAADYCGADWNEQAAASAENYLSFMGFSRSGLIDQLMFEGFTREQAEYGVNAVGL